MGILEAADVFLEEVSGEKSQDFPCLVCKHTEVEHEAVETDYEEFVAFVCSHRGCTCTVAMRVKQC